MGHVGHEVDGVVPDDGHPWCLRQDFIDWALGDSRSASWRQALPVGFRHKNHSCNDPGDPRIALHTHLARTWLG
jgi:hypothetical protein